MIEKLKAESNSFKDLKVAQKIEKRFQFVAKNCTANLVKVFRIVDRDFKSHSQVQYLQNKLQTFTKAAQKHYCEQFVNNLGQIRTEKLNSEIVKQTVQKFTALRRIMRKIHAQQLIQEIKAKKQQDFEQLTQVQ